DSAQVRHVRVGARRTGQLQLHDVRSRIPDGFRGEHWAPLGARHATVLRVVIRSRLLADSYSYRLGSGDAEPQFRGARVHAWVRHLLRVRRVQARVAGGPPPARARADTHAAARILFAT